MKKTVRDILRHKGKEVWTISPDAMIYEALQLMAEKNVGALLVCKSENEVVGIISERDYARKTILKGKFSKETPVSEIMTTKVIYVRPEYKLEECMSLMSDKHVRHLPVLEDDKLIGIVSIGDIVNGLLDHREFIIDQLVTYVQGNR